MLVRDTKDDAVKCPYDSTISIIGNKWSLTILKVLHFENKPMRFNEILRSIKPISSKTLSAKLKQLTNYGILERKVISEFPVKISYEVTEKGKDLNKILDAMAEWSIKWKMNIEC